MIWHKASVYINMLMEANMSVIGKTISNMVLVKNIGMMEVNIKGSIRLPLKKDRENIFGLKGIDILENGRIICLMGKDFSFGMIIDSS